MIFSRETFERDGAALIADVVSPEWLNRLEPLFVAADGRPGRRLSVLDDALGDALTRTGPLGELAALILQGPAYPVRVLLFDKSDTANWAVNWHQDRQIAVADCLDSEGFRNWTRKDGVDHVEPPFEYLERLITLRLHLDDCGLDNGPLRIVPGSHLLGRVEDNRVKQISETNTTLAIEAQRGDVVVLRSCILHASDRAIHPKRRRVLHVEFSPDVRPGPLEWALQVRETA